MFPINEAGDWSQESDGQQPQQFRTLAMFTEIDDPGDEWKRMEELAKQQQKMVAGIEAMIEELQADARPSGIGSEGNESGQVVPQLTARAEQEESPNSEAIPSTGCGAPQPHRGERGPTRHGMDLAGGSPCDWTLSGPCVCCPGPGREREESEHGGDRKVVGRK